jgi:hypothetical protein
VSVSLWSDKEALNWWGEGELTESQTHTARAQVPWNTNRGNYKVTSVRNNNDC